MDKEKLKQMVLQFLQNAGEEGAKRDAVYDYLKDVLPQQRTKEQHLRIVGDILNAMKSDGAIHSEGRTWYVS